MMVIEAGFLSDILLYCKMRPTTTMNLLDLLSIGYASAAPALSASALVHILLLGHGPMMKVFCAVWPITTVYLGPISIAEEIAC